MSLVQIVSGCWNYVVFHEAYRESELETTERLARFIQQNILKVTRAGIPVEELHRLDEYLRQMAAAVPSIAQMTVTGAQGERLYSAYREKGASGTPDISIPLGTDGKGNPLSLDIAIADEPLAQKCGTSSGTW